MATVVFIFLMVLISLGSIGTLYKLTKPLSRGGITFGVAVFSFFLAVLETLAIIYLYVD